MSLDDGAEPFNLLLVEDDDGDAAIFADLLAQTEMTVSVQRATSAQEARTRLQARWQPGVLVIDLGLPDLSGMDVLEQLAAAAPGAAMLVMTGLNDLRAGLDAVAAGAHDYLVKGQVTPRSLDRALRYAVQRKRFEESTRQLVASRMQSAENARLERGLLPQPAVQDPRLAVFTGYRPGRHQALLGGDFYDVVEDEEHRLHVVLGDVSGHGPDEAALGVLLRVAARMLVIAQTPPERVLPLLSRLTEVERRSDETFATALYLVVEADRRVAHLFNAGHPMPISVRTAPQSQWSLSGGLPLGLGARTWPVQRLDLDGSWPILLYTDGLVEGRDGSPDPAGRLDESGLLRIVGALRSQGCPLPELIGKVIAAAEDANGDALSDDVAVICIDAQPPAATPPG